MPVLVCITYILNTGLSYFYIDVPLLSTLSGVSVITILLMYLCSYVFNFCSWHRLLIHYITLNAILDNVDYYIGIPLKSVDIYLIHIILLGILILGLAYDHIKVIKR